MAGWWPGHDDCSSSCRLGFWRVGGTLSPVAPFGHELVELLLIARLAEPLKKFAEFLLLFLQAAQCFSTILVERPVAARWRVVKSSVPAATSVASSLTSLAGKGPASIFPECHASTPYEIKQDCEARRPEEDETNDHQRNPGWFAQIINLRNELHQRPHVNV